jgi:hypothetical protein
LNGNSVARTDEEGNFDIATGPVVWGTNVFTARRIGYIALTDAVWIDETTSNHPFTVRIQPLPFELPEVVVEGDRVVYAFGRMREFWQRRKVRPGTFITRWEIEERNPIVTSDLLRTVPGLSVVRTGSGGTAVLSSRATRRCRPTVYMDGIRLVTGQELDIDTFTNPAWIEGIEIYTGAANIPVQFNVTGLGCGAIVIWTR